MNPLEPNPPAEVRRHAAADEKIAEYKALDHEQVQAHIQSADRTARMGKLLLEAKAAVGPGHWLAYLDAKRISRRTAQYQMRQAKCANLAHLTNGLMALTHGGEEELTDDDDDTSAATTGSETAAGVRAGPQNTADGVQNDAGQNAGQQPAAPPSPPGPKRSSEWSKPYRNRAFLLEITHPRLHKKLVDGEITMPPEELWRLTAWACRKCADLGRPAGGRECDTCAKNRAERKGDLLQSKSEPADPDDPTSPPEKPVAGRLDELDKMATLFSRKMTEALNDPDEDCVRLRQILTACRVVDYQGGTPRFRALSGVATVIKLAPDPEVSVQEAAHQYEIASGAFVPPVFERQKGKRDAR